MNNPWPSNSDLRREELATQLLGEQLEAETQFRAAVGDCLTTIKRLDFPLGCPCPGYDLPDITTALADWLLPQDEHHNFDAACDLANCIIDNEAA